MSSSVVLWSVSQWVGDESQKADTGQDEPVSQNLWLLDEWLSVFETQRLPSA